MSSSLTLEGAGAANFLFFRVTVGDGGVGMGVGARGWSGSTGVSITFKTGSGSPVCSLKLGDDDGYCEVRSIRAGSDPGLDFASKSLQSRGGPEFTPVNGPGMPGFKPDVAGCNFVSLRFEVLAGGCLSSRTSRVLPLGDGGGGFGKLVCDKFPTMCVHLAVPISKGAEDVSA